MSNPRLFIGLLCAAVFAVSPLWAEAPTGTPEPVDGGECVSTDLTVGPQAVQDPDLWEQMADAENTGQYVKPDHYFTAQFNENVSLEKVADQISIKSFGPLLKKDGEWLPCDDLEVEGATEEVHTIPVTLKYYMGIKTIVAVRHDEDPFIKGCPYILELKKGPLTGDGKCLAEDKLLPFFILPDELTRFERETTDVTYDLPTGSLRSFRIKDNVTIRPDKLWKRYQKEIGWRTSANNYFGIDKIVQLGEPKEDPTKPGWYTSKWKQKYKDVPVSGGGFVVRTEGEFVRSVVGRFVPRLDIDVVPSVSEANALAAALSVINAQQYVWDWKPNQFSQPEGKLIIFSGEDSAEAVDFRLAWRFKVAAHQPFLSDTIVIDAHSGDVLKRVSNIRYLEPPTVSDVQYGPGLDVPGYGVTLYDSPGGTPRTDAQVGRFRDGEGTEYYVLRNNIGAAPTGDSTGPSQAGKVTTLYYSKATGLMPIYNVSNTDVDGFDGIIGKPPGQKEGFSVHWALQRAIEYVNQLSASSADKKPNFPANTPVLAIVAKDLPMYSGGALFPHCNEFFEGLPEEVQSGPCLVFSLDFPDLNPVVSPDVVGHEFYHFLDAHFLKHGEVTVDSRIIEEGLADIFGKLLEFSIRGDAATWRLAKDVYNDNQDKRNIESPENSYEGPFPSAYQDPTWKSLDQTCPVATAEAPYADLLCLGHARSTVVSHAFYLMIHGGEGVNSLGCDYTVMPLDAVTGSNVESRRKAGDILWKTLDTFLPLAESDELDLNFLRTVTFLSAIANSNEGVPIDEQGKPLYPPEVKTVMDAWHAVGVGSPSNVQEIGARPRNGATNIEPWPISFDMTVPNESQAWQIQVSTRLEFDCAETDQSCSQGQQDFNVVQSSQLASDASVSIGGAGLTSLFLKPATRYYWRYRIKPSDPQMANVWSPCDPVLFFQTASKAPQLVKPAGGVPMGGTETTRRLSFGDSLEWQSVDRAIKYWVKISDKPDAGCRVQATLPMPGQRKTVTSTTSTTLDPEEAGFDLAPDKTYYWYARAGVMIDAQSQEIMWGDCSNGGKGIPFKTAKLPVPTLNAPEDAADLDYEPPFNLKWNPVENASNYELQVRPSNISDAWQSYSTASTEKDLELEMPDQGYCWRVRALFSHDRKSEWSHDRCFKLKLQVPELKGPNQHMPYDDFFSGNYEWNSVPGAASYNLYLYQRLDDGSIGSLQNTVSVPGLSYSLSSGSWWCWSVAGVSSHGVAGPASDIECFSVGPGIPQNLRVEFLDPMSPTTWGARLSWSSVGPKAGGFKIDQTRTPPAVLHLPPETTSWHVDAEERSYYTPLTGNNQYAFTVRALDPAGGPEQVSETLTITAPKVEEEDMPEAEPEPEPEPASAGSCTTPAKPTGLSPPGHSAFSTSIQTHPHGPQMTWNAVSGAVEYRVTVYRFNPASSTMVGAAGTYDISNTSLSFPYSFLGGGYYSFGVAAINECGDVGPEETSMYFIVQ